MEKTFNPTRHVRNEVPNTTFFNAYLNIFTLNVINRIPDVTYLNDVNVEDIQQIADFAAACTPIVLDTWNRVTQDQARRAA